jgi:hypothetical protein
MRTSIWRFALSSDSDPDGQSKVLSFLAEPAEAWYQWNASNFI